MTGRTGIVELADPLTWPEAIRGLVSAQPAWSGTDSASDLEVYYDPGAVVAALDGYRLRAFHATRLLDQEVQEVRAKGLRRLGPELVKDRLAGAVAVGALTKEEARYYAAHHLARSPDTHEAVRVGQVCLVAGRTWLDYAEGKCGSQLAYWGGEVLDFPLDRQSISSRRLGRPTIVVADLALAAEDLRSGYEEGWLVKAFVAVHVGLGGDQTMATVNYRSADISPAEIVAIWRPGDPCYDRHPNLPTD